MDLSIIKMLENIFSFIFSNISSIVIFLAVIGITVLSIINIKKESKLVSIIIAGVYIGTIFGILVSSFDFFAFFLNSFVKDIVRLFYFPAPVLYLSMIFGMIIINIITIFKDNMPRYSKLINFIFCNIIYLLFFMFLTIITKNGLPLKDMKLLYSNIYILSIVRISNLIFIIYLIIRFFIVIYNYIKNEYF